MRRSSSAYFVWRVEQNQTENCTELENCERTSPANRTNWSKQYFGGARHFWKWSIKRFYASQIDCCDWAMCWAHVSRVYLYAPAEKLHPVMHKSTNTYLGYAFALLKVLLFINKSQRVLCVDFEWRKTVDFNCFATRRTWNDLSVSLGKYG